MSRKNNSMRTTKYCLSLCVGTTLALGAMGASSLAAELEQIPASNGGAVDAQRVGEAFEPIFVPTPEGAEQGDLRPMHPPIDEIPAMEMPDPDLYPAGGIDAEFGPGQPVIYNQQTGEQRLLPAPLGSEAIGGSEPGYDAPSGGEGMDEWFYQGLESFGTKSLINDATVGSDPWRRNCKLVIQYNDSNPNVNPIFRVCSAGMADAETVLTAGHCVYKRDLDSQGNEYGWADAIWVYPGWDGDGLALGTPGIIDTHGWARSTSLGSWSGWTANGDFDRDMGLIRIDRAVGMLTSWYGWRWGGSCASIQARTYNVGAYPAESCGGGLHNGRDMYYWWGQIDDCPGNQMEIDTTVGCLTALWGGESGSNLYDIDNGNRFAHGVASTSNRTTIGRYCKMWEGFKDFMLTFEDASRTSTFDLQALEARFGSDTTLTAGQSTVGSETVQVPNPTNANPASATIPFTTRLSSNSNISEFDTLLANLSYTFDYAAMQNVNVNMPAATIPYNTPSGTYWLGVLLDSSVDSTSSNNDSDLWDAHQITVNGVADLEAVFANVISTTWPQYSTIPMSYSVTNLGGDPSNSATMSVRISTNDFITTFDQEIASLNLGTFSGNQNKAGSVDITIPAVTPGDYWIGIIVTASDDVDSSNDWDADSLPITVIECPADLTNDGVVDSGDLQQFINWFLAGNINADLTNDGVVDSGDLQMFINLFLAGC